MKNYVFICIYIVFNFYFSLAQDFTIKRSMTDYNGVCIADGYILAYGDEGVITYSEDNGKSWGLINLGLNHNIRFLLNLNNTFYAFTDSILFKTSNPLKKWREIPFHNINQVKDVEIYDDKLYVLRNDGVFIYNNQHDLLDSIELDFGSLGNMEIDNEIIFITIQNDFSPTISNKLLKIELQSNNVNVIEELKYYYLDNGVKKDTTIMPSILQSQIMFKNNTLYLPCVGMQYFSIVSYDFGANFELIVPFHQAFTFANFWNTESLLEIRFSFPEVMFDTLDFSTKRITTSILSATRNEIIDISQQHPFDTLRFDWYASEIGRSKFIRGKDIIRECERVDDSTLIIVGMYNTIVMSYDNGKSWELKNYFHNNTNDLTCKLLNDSNLLVFGYCSHFSGIIHNIYKTTNYGATWLPQRFIYPNNLVFTSVTQEAYAQSNSGELFLQYVNPQQRNKLLELHYI